MTQPQQQPQQTRQPNGSYITADTEVHGNLTTVGAMTVAGHVEGNVTAAGDVVIMDGATIKGDVSGANVRVAGEVDGRVTASARLHIGATGTVTGDISITSLQIDEGGTLQGKCSMNGQQQAASPPARPRTGTQPSNPPPRPATDSPAAAAGVPSPPPFARN